MVKEMVMENNSSQIKKLLKVLGGEFAISQIPHMRKGGLIGLAATAIGLGRETGVYTEDLINPIVTCLSDSDHRVRYFACESLYNVVKVARDNVHRHLQRHLCRGGGPGSESQNGSELLDRLLKDIVTESKKFEIAAFVPVLRERMYTQEKFVRQFLVSGTRRGQENSEGNGGNPELGADEARQERDGGWEEQGGGEQA